MYNVILHLGSNLGNRKGLLEEAMGLINREIGDIILKSSFYETSPWLGDDLSILPEEIINQSSFLNIALVVEVLLSPFEVLDNCLEIENKLGRIRNQKWGARIIDIDLVFYNDEIIDTQRLKIPHPWMEKRRFVLQPLAEIIPEWIHPLLGKTVVQLLEECEDKGKVEKV